MAPKKPTAQDEARRAALYLTWAGLAGSSAALLLLESIGMPRGPWTVVTAFSTVCLGILYITPRMPRWASLGIFSLQSILPLLAGWQGTGALASLGRPFDPFAPEKIVALAVAITSPSLALGAVLIGLTAIPPIIQVHQWPPHIRDLLPQLEPVQTVVVACLAFALLVVHRRHAALREDLACTRAEGARLQRVVRVALFVRNLTRPPIETARAALSDIGRHRHDGTRSISRMNRALDRLERLNETIAPLDRVLPGQPPALSFDELPYLERELDRHQERTHKERLPSFESGDETRRAVICEATLSVLAGILVFAELRLGGGYPTWGALLLGVPGVMALASVLAFPSRSARLNQVIFVAVGLCVTTYSLVANAQMAQRGTFDAFLSFKITALVFAFLAPSGRIGAALIGISALAPVAETYLWFSPLQRSRIALLEPWLTVVVCLTAFAVLAAQRQHARAVREWAEAQADRDSLTRIARLALSVCDLANSPLQTLFVETELVGKKNAALVLTTMRDSLFRLKQLNVALARLSRLVEWKEQGVAFDAVENIAAEVRECVRASEAHSLLLRV
jgi:hypothetical protein